MVHVQYTQIKNGVEVSGHSYQPNRHVEGFDREGFSFQLKNECEGDHPTIFRIGER